MTQEEFLRFQNLLSTVIEQQAVFAENQTKADARMSRHEEAIASLLTIAEMHEQELVRTNEQMNSGFAKVTTQLEQVTQTFQEIAEKSGETDERINALMNIVEKYLSKEN